MKPSKNRGENCVHKFDKAAAGAVKRKKSIVTVGGQREKPGMSMNVVLDWAGLIDKVTLAAKRATREAHAKEAPGG